MSRVETRRNEKNEDVRSASRPECEGIKREILHPGWFYWDVSKRQQRDAKTSMVGPYNTLLYTSVYTTALN